MTRSPRARSSAGPWPERRPRRPDHALTTEEALPPRLTRPPPREPARRGPALPLCLAAQLLAIAAAAAPRAEGARAAPGKAATSKATAGKAAPGKAATGKAATGKAAARTPTAAPAAEGPQVTPAPADSLAAALPAAAREPTVAILVEGVEAEALRELLSRALPAGLRAADGKALAAALQAEGQRLPMGPGLYDPRRRGAQLRALRLAAAASGAGAAVVALGFRKGPALTVVLSWIDPRAALPLGGGAVRLSGDGARDRAALGDLLARPATSLLSACAPAALAQAPRPADAARPGPRDDRAAGAAPGTSTPPASLAGGKQPAPGRASAAAAPGQAAPVQAPGSPGPGQVARTQEPEASQQPAAATETVPAPSGAAAPSQARPRGQVATALFVGEVGLDFGGRRFGYSDPITSNLPDYAVFGAPMLSTAVELYPAALTRLPVLRDLGLTAHVAHAFGLSSETAGGTPVGTDWTRAGGGLRYRAAPAFARGVVGGLSLGVESTSFRFDAGGDLTSVLASVRYLSVRVGLDVRVPLWRFALLLSGAYDAPVQSGEVAARFRDPSVGGVDLGLGLGFRVGAGFEVGVRARYERYFYAFRPEPGDAYVAGGALDELFSFGGAVTYAY